MGRTPQDLVHFNSLEVHLLRYIDIGIQVACYFLYFQYKMDLKDFVDRILKRRKYLGAEIYCIYLL